jgi:hypothetical protein
MEQHDILLLDNDESMTYKEAMMGPVTPCFSSKEETLEIIYLNK